MDPSPNLVYMRSSLRTHVWGVDLYGLGAIFVSFFVFFSFIDYLL